jgi:hypothetical protein
MPRAMSAMKDATGLIGSVCFLQPCSSLVKLVAFNIIAPALGHAKQSQLYSLFQGDVCAFLQAPRIRAEFFCLRTHE